MTRLALIQMLVEGGRPAENLERARSRIGQAAAAGARIVLLPETLDCGWTHPSAREHASMIPDGASCRALRQAAREHHVYVCAGLTERSGNQIFNAAVFIQPDGEVVLHHRKLNELEIGHDLYSQGDRLGVVPTPLGTVGVMICADAFARGQVVSRTLGLMGAQLLLSPCAWAVPADHDQEKEAYGRLWLDNYSPVARDFRLWIAGASNVGRLTAGPWNGRACIGCSLAVGPNGRQVLMGPYGPDAETILFVDLTLDPRPARGDGWETWWCSSR